jgi:hypothetical protein
MSDEQPDAERRHRTHSSQDPDDIERRFSAGSARMDRIETMIKINTADTAEVLEIIRMGKSFFKLIGYLGKVIKFTAPIVASLAGVYYAIKGGKQ